MVAAKPRSASKAQRQRAVDAEQAGPSTAGPSSAGTPSDRPLRVYADGESGGARWAPAIGPECGAHM